MQREVVDIDHVNLRDMLNVLIKDLSIPYLEKRARSSSHKQSGIEELSEVIHELSQRERELQAAAGIATLLLDNNEVLQEKANAFDEKMLVQKEKCRLLKEKIKVLKNQTLPQERIKVEEAQDSIIKLTNENESLFRRLNSLKDLPDIHHDELDKYRSKITDLKNTYQQQIIDLKTKVNSLNDTIFLERNNKDKAQDELADKVFLINELREEIKKLKKKNELLENKLQKSLKNVNELEDDNEKLSEMKDHYRDRMKKLKNKVGILKIIAQKNEHLRPIADYEEETTQEACSLKSELQEMEIAREAFVDVLKGISVLPSYKRKSPDEEFFLLTAQSILIGLPYIEAVCNVSVKELYGKALQTGIPFHKWHTWIEKELNSAYIQKIYNDFSRVSL